MRNRGVPLSGFSVLFLLRLRQVLAIGLMMAALRESVERTQKQKKQSRRKSAKKAS